MIIASLSFYLIGVSKRTTKCINGAFRLLNPAKFSRQEINFQNQSFYAMSNACLSDALLVSFIECE